MICIENVSKMLPFHNVELTVIKEVLGNYYYHITDV